MPPTLAELSFSLAFSLYGNSEAIALDATRSKRKKEIIERSKAIEKEIQTTTLKELLNFQLNDPKN